MERWLPIAGYEGIYEVSDSGRIKRIGNSLRGCMTRKGPHLLSPAKDTDGYRQFKLHDAPRRPKMIKVHRVVMEAFVGPMPDGLQVNHKDRDKDNNSLLNLEYVTCLRNIQHAVETGRRAAKGSELPQSKLNEEQAIFIKRSNISQKELSDMFAVQISTISRIKSGSRWRHLA